MRARVVFWLGFVCLVGVVILLGWGPRLNLPSFRGSEVQPLDFAAVTFSGYPADSTVVLTGAKIMYRAGGSYVKAVNGGYELLLYSDSVDGGVTWIFHSEPKIVRSSGFEVVVQ